MNRVVLASLVAAAGLPVSAWSQADTPGAPRCYRLIQSEWSRPLGVNAAYHVIPEVVRLDTASAPDGSRAAAPDIAYPTPSRARGMPRWTHRGDSIQIVWSTRFQATTIRLGPSQGDDLRGTATVFSDANEFGTDLPRATIDAKRTSCAGVP